MYIQTHTVLNTKILYVEVEEEGDGYALLTLNKLTCTEPCLSAGVRLPSVAPGLGTSGHAATPPLAFV